MLLPLRLNLHPRRGTLAEMPASAVPSTGEERRSLDERLQRAEQMIEEATGLTAVVAASNVVEKTPAAVDVGREMRDALEDFRLMLEIEAERLKLIGMMDAVQRMVEKLQQQIEELDVIFVTFMIVATDQDAPGSGKPPIF